MLKNLVLMLVVATGSWAYAQNSGVRFCIDSLQYSYLAPYNVALGICSQNSSREFVRCMNEKSETTNLEITEVVPQCSRRVQVASTFGTCESKLQTEARMEYNLSRRVCHRDNSVSTIDCIVDLSQNARFHPEHATQYCLFAKTQYPNKMDTFRSCVISNSHKGYDVFSAVENCDDRITGRYVEPVRRPRPMDVPNRGYQERQQPNPNNYPQYPPPSVSYGDDREGGQPGSQTVQPQPQPQQPPQAQPEPALEEPKKKTGTSKVPVPVEIKVQESSKPKVEDKPLDSQSTENAEELPL